MPVIKKKPQKTSKSKGKKTPPIAVQSAPLIQSVMSPKISEKERKEKKAQLQKLVATINKDAKEKLLIFGSEIEVKALIRVDSQALPSLDFGIGGGLPRGRVVTISGPFSSCKSAIGYRYVGNHQRLGHACALIDVEGTYTPEWGAIHGIDNAMLLYIRPETAEEAMSVAAKIARSGVVDFIMLDSIEALSPKDEVEKDFDESSRLGIKPQLVGMFLRKMNSINNKLTRNGEEGVTLLLINQLREKPMSMGDPEYEPGGRAIGFYSSIQIRIRRGDWIRVGSGKKQRIVGQIVKYKVTKNKTYKMLQTGEFDFYTDETNALGLPAGTFDTAKQLVIEGVAWGIIQQTSAGRFVVAGKKIHGLESLIEEIRNDTRLGESVRQQIMTLVLSQSSISTDDLVTEKLPPEALEESEELFNVS